MTVVKVVSSSDDVDYRGGRSWKEVNADELASEFGNIARSVDEMFNAAESSSGKLLTSSIEVTLVISASGKLGILGSSVEGKAEAGIKVTFVRK